MSEENVEIVRAAFAAFAQQGPDGLVDSWDSEIELWMPSGLIQAGGTYRGKAAVLGWMREWADAWEEIDYTPEEFTEAGDGVLVTVLYEGRGKASGVRIDGRFWYLFTLRKGKVVRWELYPEKVQALEAAGLRE
ncbi:MAG: nuclear transport factor 2 family protein [Solirubrobacterales bacterium]